jgi:hypothetical protein
MPAENPSQRSDAAVAKGLVERLLSKIADVRRGEASGGLFRLEYCRILFR